MAACSCGTITEFALDCTPSIGGIASVEVGDIAVQVIPDTSSFNAVMTYDKTKNLKYWTVDVTLGIGEYNSAAKTFVDSLPCPVGRTIELTMNSGKVITISDAFVQTGTFNSGAAKTDGYTGTVVFQAITKSAPTVA